jgi:hypothetical protein
MIQIIPVISAKTLSGAWQISSPNRSTLKKLLHPKKNCSLCLCLCLLAVHLLQIAHASAAVAVVLRIPCGRVVVAAAVAPCRCRHCRHAVLLAPSVAASRRTAAVIQSSWPQDMDDIVVAVISSTWSGRSRCSQSCCCNVLLLSPTALPWWLTSHIQPTPCSSGVMFLD